MVSPKLPGNSKKLEREMREFLSVRGECRIKISLENTYVASYRDTTLPLDSTTQVWRLDDKRVTAAFIEALYRF